jgi:hypothetical protein
LTGSDINLATLGKVPAATLADKATAATHASTADSATTAAAATALASVAYRVDTSAGAITVPPCAANPCTPDQVGTTFATATCPAGTVAIGGGGVTADAGVELSGSFPSGPSTWEVDVDNWLQTASSVDYFVICTQVKAIDNG